MGLKIGKRKSRDKTRLGITNNLKFYVVLENTANIVFNLL